MAEEAYRRYMTENALEHRRLPEPAPHAAGRRRHRGRVAARRARGRRLHDDRRHREHPPGRRRPPGSGAGPSEASTRPNVVLPASAHAAFEKGAALLRPGEPAHPGARPTGGRTSGRWPPPSTTSTVLVVASAPQYPQGVIDPVAEIAALAAERGHQLPRRRLHGRGHAPLPRPAGPGRRRRSTSPSTASRRCRSTCTSSATRPRAPRSSSTAPGRCGATRCSSPSTGSAAPTARRASSARSRAAPSPRPGPCCTTWATTATCAWRRIARAATEALAAGIRAQPELVLRAPSRRRCCWPSARPIPTALDVFAVADALWRRGWYVDRQGPPPSLHCTVNAVHERRIPEFLIDLRAALDEVLTAGARGDRGAYGTVE